MAIPASAKPIPEPLDPSDIDKFAIEITRAPATAAVPFPMLEEGEGIASFTLTMGAEGSLVGARIRQDAQYLLTLAGLEVRGWISVDDPSLPVFDPGLSVAMVLTLNTDSIPPRRKQRTVTVKLINQ